MKAGSMLFGIFVSARLIMGDVIECDNGDRYNGKVLSMDEKKVTLRNEITGVLTIPRDRIISMNFREAKAASVKKPSAPGATNGVPVGAGALRIDPGAVNRVQNELLATATPEANQMFNEMVRGLINGQLNVADVRNKAQSTLQELRQLQRELGDDEAAGLLDTYGAILEGFLQQSQPATTTRRPQASDSIAE